MNIRSTLIANPKPREFGSPTVSSTISPILSLTRREPEAVPPVVRQDHPDRTQLQRFMSGDLPRTEVALIVRHMLTGCTQCLQVTRQFWELIE